MKFEDLLADQAAEKSLLHKAVEENHRAAVRAILGVGADVNEADRNGETPVFAAVRNGNLEMVRLLIEWNASVDVVNRRHQSVTDIAVICNKNDILKFLLRHSELVKQKSVKLAAVLKHSGSKQNLDEEIKRRVFKARLHSIVK